LKVSDLPCQAQAVAITGRRVAIIGRLASMSRRDAEEQIRARGGRLVERPEGAHWLVIGDGAGPATLSAVREGLSAESRSALARGDIELVRESDFWSRLGLVDAGLGVARLYTPAMLAALVQAPIAAVRQWHRQGALRATREVRRLPYFDFEEVCVARKLAALRSAGCSPSAVSRRLGELARLWPESQRPLADPDVVAVGRRLYVRRGASLAEPGGQLLIDFDATPAAIRTDDSGPVALPFAAAEALRGAAAQPARGAHPYAAEDLRALAAELEECGRSDQAIEVYRAILVSGQSAPDDHFALAELLYGAGDLSAARERYYAAIELDEDFVEARANLGCVLAEQGELELAESAFRGALEYHPHYADAHYHLARLLDRLGRGTEAAAHWRQFTTLAPASPWADEARQRIDRSAQTC
jgi:tetratricopeptide (TPR) repeat protein